MKYTQKVEFVNKSWVIFTKTSLQFKKKMYKEEDLYYKQFTHAHKTIFISFYRPVRSSLYIYSVFATWFAYSNHRLYSLIDRGANVYLKKSCLLFT